MCKIYVALMRPLIGTEVPMLILLHKRFNEQQQTLITYLSADYQVIAWWIRRREIAMYVCGVCGESQEAPTIGAKFEEKGPIIDKIGSFSRIMSHF